MNNKMLDIKKHYLLIILIFLRCKIMYTLGKSKPGYRRWVLVYSARHARTHFLGIYVFSWCRG